MECNCDVCTGSVDFDKSIDYCGELCEHCGKDQDNCYCDFCDYCNEHIEDCECDYCEHCDQHERDCECEAELAE